MYEEGKKKENVFFYTVRESQVSASLYGTQSRYLHHEQKLGR